MPFSHHRVLERLNELEKKKPLSKKLLIIGSSVVVGTGASSNSLGYANLMAAELVSKGWTVTNIAVNGSTSQNWVEGSTSPVVPKLSTMLDFYKPDVLYIGLGIGNTLIDAADTLTTKQSKYNSFLDNFRTLVRMARNAKIPVIAGGSYPRASFDDTVIRNMLHQLNKEIYAMNIPVFHFLGALGDSTTQYATLRSDFNSGDGIHPNNLGHRAMYACCAIDAFDAVLFEKNNLRPSAFTLAQTPYLGLSATSDSVCPLYVSQFSTENSIFTAAFILNAQTGAASSKNLLTFYHPDFASNPFRMRNPTTLQPEIYGGGSTTIVSANFTLTANTDALVVMSVDFLTKLVIVTVNGSETLRTTYSGMTQTSATEIHFTGRPGATGGMANYRISQMMAWKGMLTNRDHAELNSGHVCRHSLLACCPVLITDSYAAGASLTNEAPYSSHRLAVNDASATISL